MRQLSLIALIVVMFSTAALAQAIRPTEGLFLPAVRSGGRTILAADPIEAQIVAGTFVAPTRGDRVRLHDGRETEWGQITADAEGAFRGAGGGYAYFAVEAPRDGVMILWAAGHSMVY